MRSLPVVARRCLAANVSELSAAPVTVESLGPCELIRNTRRQFLRLVDRPTRKSAWGFLSG